MNHFNLLPNAFQTEWTAAKHQTITLVQDCALYNDGSKHWWIETPEGANLITWECRPFPGCASLVVTTKVVLREENRGQGLGRFFRELRHKGYARAGFRGEIATVRTDNAPQNKLMQTMGATKMGEFPSDFGGTYALWLTHFAHPPAQILTRPNATPAPEPLPQTLGVRNDVGSEWAMPRVGVQAHTHNADWSGVVMRRVELPANPTTLGNVWVGTTRPTVEAIRQVQTLNKRKFSHRSGA